MFLILFIFDKNVLKTKFKYFLVIWLSKNKTQSLKSQVLEVVAFAYYF